MKKEKVIMFRNMPNPIRFLVLVAVMLLMLGGCGGSPLGGSQVIVVTATPGPTSPPSPTSVPPPTSTPLPTAVPTPTIPPASPTPSELTVSQIVDKMRPSTVLVDVQESTDFGGTGSGFVYDPSGLIVTNAHVVTGGALIKVHLQGSDRWFSARVIGLSPCDDLAIIQVDGGNPVPAVLGSSDALSVGDEVVALGYPKASQLGTDLTVTRGVVSRLHADIGQYSDAIQTDAAINPGNSGGPLVNLRGEVVGINTATLVGTTGINFAISISSAKPILAQLATGKKINYLGWNLVPNSTDLAKQLNLATDKGMIVAGVDSGSPASKEGLASLDIIYDMEDITLTDDAQVCDILRSHSEGQAMRMTVVRRNQLFQGEVNGAPLTFVRNLSGQGANTQPTSAPEQPTSRPAKPTSPPPTKPPAATCNAGANEARLYITNFYMGQTMRFTIGGGEWGTHDYDIPGDGQAHYISMPPGRYTYTAFIPGAGTDHGEPFDYQGGHCYQITYRP